MLKRSWISRSVAAFTTNTKAPDVYAERPHQPLENAAKVQDVKRKFGRAYQERTLPKRQALFQQMTREVVNGEYSALVYDTCLEVMRRAPELHLVRALFADMRKKRIRPLNKSFSLGLRMMCDTSPDPAGFAEIWEACQSLQIKPNSWVWQAYVRMLALTGHFGKALGISRRFNLPQRTLIRFSPSDSFAMRLLQSQKHSVQGRGDSDVTNDCAAALGARRGWPALLNRDVQYNTGFVDAEQAVSQATMRRHITKVVATLTEDGGELRTQHLVGTLSRYRHSRDLDGINEALSGFADCNFIMPLEGYSIIISACSRVATHMNDYASDLAHVWYQRAIREGFEYDVRVNRSMLQVYAANGDHESSELLLKKLRRRGLINESFVAMCKKAQGHIPLPRVCPRLAQPPRVPAWSLPQPLQERSTTKPHDDIADASSVVETLSSRAQGGYY